MYEAYWKLSCRPFDEASSAEFFYPSRTHEAALLKLRYLLDQRKGVAVLVGEHGLGKTLLTQVLEQESTRQGIAGPFLQLLFPQLSPAGLLAYFAQRLGAAVEPHESEERVLRGLEDRLIQLRSQNSHPVLIVDDAHALEMPQLQVLRLLLNLRERGNADFSLILTGRTELLSRLQRLAALDQRVVVRAAVEPLTPEEVLPYIRQRLKTSGGNPDVFQERSARTLWELSQGIPRRINQLCDLSLLVGFVDSLGTVGPVEIEAAADELLSVAA